LSLCPCGEPRVSSDHAMICRHLSSLVMQRHDHLVMTWRRTMACAELAAEPHLGLARCDRAAQRGIKPRGPHAHAVGRRRLRYVEHASGRAGLHGGGGGYHDVRSGARSGRLQACALRRLDLGAGYELVPIAVESFGRLRAPPHALLCRVVDVAADRGSVSKAAFIESVLQEMSVALGKGNGRVLRAHLSRVAQASVLVYLRGLKVPVAEVVGVKCCRASAGCM
jgi:hypothetical protein